MRHIDIGYPSMIIRFPATVSFLYDTAVALLYMVVIDDSMGVNGKLS